MNNILCDYEIIQMLKENNRIVWDFIYAKYNTMLYSDILKCTDNQVITNEIINITFAKLKANTAIVLQSGSLGLCLLVQARKTAFDLLGKL